MNTSCPLVQALLTSFYQYKHQLHGKRIWLACSGGRDSLSLARVCRQLFDSGQLPFLPQLLHVNHGIQEANTAWAHQVATWAKQQQMPCTVLNVQLDDTSEQSARQARYNAMIEVMNNDDVLLLGHHQDDQVETVLMRLFNGAGVTGLGGMKAWTPKQKPANYSSLPSETESQHCIYLWRPWLTMSRAQITAYAKASKLEYIDDPTNIIASERAFNKDGNSNAKGDYEQMPTHVNDRAWLRSTLMPLINKRYPQVNEAIYRSSQLMQDASQVIAAQVQVDLDAVIIHSQRSQSTANLYSIIDIEKLQRLILARQSAVIHSWLSPSTLELPAPKRLVDDVLELCQRSDNNHQTCLYWNSGCHQYEVRCYQNKLYRLRVEWVDWLSLPPQSLKLSIDIDTIKSAQNEIDEEKLDSHDRLTFLTLDKGMNLPDDISLKPNHPTIFWKIGSIHHLAMTLIAATTRNKEGMAEGLKGDSLKGDSLKDNFLVEGKLMQLCFEPLPRLMKLALADRQGRKSGKKLLQAINQPSFLRQSVVLCSLIGCSLKKEADEDANVQNNKTALFLIAIDGIYLLQSPFSQKLKTLIDHYDLSAQVVYTTA